MAIAFEDPNDNTKMIPNPKSKLEFAQEAFKNNAAMPWLLQFINQDIDFAIGKKLNEEKVVLKKQAFDELSAAVTIG